MASTTTQTPRSKPAPSELLVENQFQLVEKRIRFLDIFQGMILLTSGIVCWFLILVLLDRLFQFSLATRQLALTVFVVIALVGFGLLILKPCLMKINPFFTALRLEQNIEGSKNSLINWLDLHNLPLPSAIRGSITNKALNDLKNVDLEQTLPATRLYPFLGILGALAFLMFLLMMTLGPGSFFALLARVVFPISSSNKVLPLQTQINIIRPEEGDTIIPPGTAITILVRIEGYIPQVRDKNSLRIHWRGLNNAVYQERNFQPLESPREWSSVLSAEEVAGGVFYKVSGGDAETSEYRISVQANPAITAFQATYRYANTLGKEIEVTKNRKIEALRGTEVILQVQTNRVLKTCQMLLDSGTSKTTIPGTISAEDSSRFQVRFTMGQGGLYRLGFQTHQDEVYTDAIYYPLVSLADLPPVVEINRPNKDIELPANGILVVEGKASDDYGLKSLTLQFKAQGGPLFQGKEYRADRGGLRLPVGSFPRLVEYREELDFQSPIKTMDGKPYVIQPGMEMEYWLEATDICENPKPNRSQSKHYKIRFTPPVDEKRQKEERGSVRKDRENHQENEEKQRQNEEKQREEKGRKDREEAEKKQSQQGDGTGNQSEKPDPNSTSSDSKKPDSRSGGLDSQTEKQTREQAEKLAQEGTQQKEGQGSDAKNDSNQNQQPGKAKGGGDPAQEKDGNPDNKNQQNGNQANSKSPGVNKSGDHQPESGSGEQNKEGQNKTGSESKQQSGGVKESSQDGKSNSMGEEKPASDLNQGDSKSPSETKGNGQSKSVNDKTGDKQENASGSGKQNPGGAAKENSGQSKSEKNGESKTSDPSKDAQKPAETKSGDSNGGKQEINSGVKKPGPDSNSSNSNPNSEKSQSKPGNESAKPEKPNPETSVSNGQGNGQKNDVTPSEGNPKTSSNNPERKTLDQIQKNLQDPDEKIRAEAMKELEKIREQTRDKEIQDLANQLANQQKTGTNKPMDPLQENKKDQPGSNGSSNPKSDPASHPDKTANKENGKAKEGENPAKPGDSQPADNKPGEGKPGDRTQKPISPGLAKDEGPGGRDEKSQGKPQGVPRGGGDIDMHKNPDAALKETPVIEDKTPVKGQKATEAQLEHFKKLLDKKMLERLQMTEQARDQFLKNYEKLVQQDKTSLSQPELPDQSQRFPGTLPSTKSNSTPNPNVQGIPEVGGIRNSKAPPGYQNDHAEFLRKLAEISKSR